MKRADHAQTLAWLKTNPSLDELCARYPAERATVQQDIVARSGARKNHDAVLSQFIRSRMAHDSVSLAKLLPPELEPAIYLFRHKSSVDRCD